MGETKKAVFLDRDGVLVKNVAYGNEVDVAARKAEDLELLPEVPTVLKSLHDAGFLLVVVSNQPDIALGKIDEPTRISLEKRFEELIKEEKLPIDEIYYCHHHSKGVVAKYRVDCDCRKPKPGMLLRAVKEHNIDLAESFLLGDRASDIKAGEDAGVKKTILYDPKETQTPYLLDLNVTPDYTVKTLGEAAKIICKQ